MRKRGYAVSDDSRYIKAKKIIACLEYFDGNLQDREILEIGCGAGIISYEISTRVRCLTAGDITDQTLRNTFKKTVAKRSIGELPFQFVLSDGTSLPFRNGSFDIVVCNQVFEHVIDQQKLVSEIHRVLKSGSFCYMATGNKLWPIEPHTKLPFLSCLPKSIADKYVRRFRGINEYDVTLPTYWRFKRFLSDRFDRVIDLTPLIIKHPRKFYLTSEIPKPVASILARMPLQILQMFLPLLSRLDYHRGQKTRLKRIMRIRG